MSEELQIELTLPVDDRRTTARIFCSTKPEMFRDDFDGWLLNNWYLYLRFEKEANRVAHRRTHYSANTIIEYLRHETAMRDSTDEEFKFNDRWTSSIARLYGLMNPINAGLFEYRERRDGVVSGAPAA